MVGSSAIVRIFIFLSAFCILPLVRQYLGRRKAIRERGCQNPRSIPQKDPIFGLDVAFRMFRSYHEGSRSAAFKKQHEISGSTFQSIALGKTRIFTTDPVNLRAILSTDFKDWGVQPLRLPPWRPFLGEGVMNTDGEFWKRSRALVQPMFRKEHITDLASFDVHVARLIDSMPKDGSTVDMQPLFARLILGFTIELLFGESLECDTPNSDGDAMAFLEAFHYGQEGIGRRTQLPMLTVFTRDKSFWQAGKTVREFVDRFIDRAVLRCADQTPGRQRKYILADELVKRTKDRKDIRNQLLNVFLAAHDTTSVLLTNVFFNLARNPNVYQKLRHEILHIDLSKADFDGLKGLKYLQDVVTETSRLTPVVGQSARIALQDTILPTGGGTSGTSPIYVRKGISVQFNFFALHRRPEVYGQDAETFRPERWDSLQVGSWDFLPFLGGPRVCPAQQMALMQVRYAVARIVQKFKGIENRDPVLEFVERYRITSDSKNGCKLALIPA